MMICCDCEEHQQEHFRPCCQPGRLDMPLAFVCNGCHQPFEKDAKILSCGQCQGVWYHNKNCQLRHWKENGQYGGHKTTCMAIAESGVIQGHVTSVLDCSIETVEALNDFTENASIGKAVFILLDNELQVEFDNANQCREWCNAMNLIYFPDQQSTIIVLRQGKGADKLGAVFRFPIEFHHLITYAMEGRVYYCKTDKTWKSRNPPKPVGYFEAGYGKEPFQNWVDRQIERLTMGTKGRRPLPPVVPAEGTKELSSY